MNVLAIDIGGTKIAVAVVSDAGTITASGRIATRASSDGEELYTALERLCRAVTADAGDISAVGVGCGGPMRWPDGIVSPLHIPLWRDFPLRARLASSFGLPVVVDNDAKAMALGEWWLGAGRGARNMLGMVVSTGVGGGVVADGKLIDGEHGHAGHIGHVNVWPGGPTCACGARGCLTAIASGTGLARRAEDAIASRTATSLRAGATAADIAAAARAGDDLARTLFDDAAACLGRAIASAASLLDLDRAVLGGSIALHAWDLLDARLEAELRGNVRTFASGVRVVRASLGDAAGLVGAARLALRV